MFLPEGTQLRVWSRENGARYAEVVGDKLLHTGRPVTPNQFVRLQEGIPRNAWMELSLLLPGETAWKAAYVRRNELRLAERALRHPVPPVEPPASSTSSPLPSSSPPAAPSASHPGGRLMPEPPHRLPRIPPIASQARLQAAQGGTSHWWPGAPERRVDQRRAEDAFLD